MQPAIIVVESLQNFMIIQAIQQAMTQFIFKENCKAIGSYIIRMIAGVI